MNPLIEHLTEDEAEIGAAKIIAPQPPRSNMALRITWADPKPDTAIRLDAEWYDVTDIAAWVAEAAWVAGAPSFRVGQRKPIPEPKQMSAGECLGAHRFLEGHGDQWDDLVDSAAERGHLWGDFKPILGPRRILPFTAAQRCQVVEVAIKKLMGRGNRLVIYYFKPCSEEHP